MFEVSRKESLWLACTSKSCCHTSIVIPTGRDVWRLARALEVPPWSFLQYFQTPVSRRDAFALDHSERRFRIALAKKAGRGKRGQPSCIFLFRTRQGEHRCGVCSLRPSVCRAFPSELVDGVLCVGSDQCTCRTWSLTDVDLAEERAAVEARQRDAEEYCALVAAWNTRVESGPADLTLEFSEYCEFLLQAYDALANPTATGV